MKLLISRRLSHPVLGAALVFGTALAPAELEAQTTIQTDGKVQAQGFVGDGSQLTNLSSAVYERVVLVGRVGSPTQNGDALSLALANINQASESNPHLLKIEPGVYDLENISLQMKPYVDIEGSGEGVTTITGYAFSGAPETNPIGTVKGVTNSELRFLTVENTRSSGSSIAIANNAASPNLLHVTAKAVGGATDNYGIYNYNSSPTMTQVRALSTEAGGANNYGMFNNSSAPTLKNVNAIAREGSSTNYGMSNVGTAQMLQIDHSLFEGASSSIDNDPDYELHVFSSRLAGDPDADGTYRCVGVSLDYGDQLIAANSSCRSGV